jgi:hypothetical protein
VSKIHPILQFNLSSLCAKSAALLIGRAIAIQHLISGAESDVETMFAVASALGQFAQPSARDCTVAESKCA